MATFEEFNVVHPPTSGEVFDEALDALRHSRALHMVLRSLREVPPPENLPVNLRIRSTVHQADLGIVVSGTLEDAAFSRRSLIVRTNGLSELPATASMVIPEL